MSLTLHQQRQKHGVLFLLLPLLAFVFTMAPDLATKAKAEDMRIMQAGDFLAFCLGGKVRRHGKHKGQQRQQQK